MKAIVFSKMIARCLSLSVMIFGLLALGCGTDSKALPAGPAPNKDTRNKPVLPTADEEFEKLKGSWKVVGIVSAGNKVPDEKVKGINLSYIFEKDKVTTHRPDRKDNSGRMTLTPQTDPKRLDFYLPGNGRTPGIYRLDGKTLTICLSVERISYPAKFESSEDPKTDLLTLEQE
jgi:uncharacterized protein (TIGR03067 family)